MTKAELDSKHIAELHTLAAEAGISGYRMLRREELIEKLASGGGGGGGGRGRDKPAQRREPRGRGERAPRRRREQGGRKPAAGREAPAKRPKPA